MHPKIDYTGQRFGELTVVQQAPRKHLLEATRWLCRCDAGHEVTRTSTAFRKVSPNGMACRECAAARSKYPPRNRPGRRRTRPSSQTIRVSQTQRIPRTPHHWRPRTRGDCDTVPRPCPYVGCVHHLWLDATAIGNIKLNFPNIEPWEMRKSCSLDAAERGGMCLDDVAWRMNLTKERVRQLELSARDELNGRLHLRVLYEEIAA